MLINMWLQQILQSVQNSLQQCSGADALGRVRYTRTAREPLGRMRYTRTAREPLGHMRYTRTEREPLSRMRYTRTAWEPLGACYLPLVLYTLHCPR